jgi:hypothetical protein
MIVARPRAVPIPLPLIAFGPTRLNLHTQVFSVKKSKAYHYFKNSHWCILQHIWHDEEPNHTSPDIHLVQLRHPTIPASNSDILQRNIILGCVSDNKPKVKIERIGICSTFGEFSLIKFRT